MAAVGPAGHTSARAVALVRAAIVELSRVPVFRTVTTSPSLEEVSLVEPRVAREATTSHVEGPAGRGVLRAVVTGGTEYLAGDVPGWSNLLRLLHAPPATIAGAESLAGSWFVEPPARAALVDGFGPSLSGIGHVFCTGAACSLAGARVAAGQVVAAAGRVVVAVPAFGGDLVLDPAAHLRPVALLGTGARKGLRMRFSYPRGVPLLYPPASSTPAPPAISG